MINTDDCKCPLCKQRGLRLSNDARAFVILFVILMLLAYHLVGPQ